MERQDTLRVFTRDNGFIFIDDALVEVKFIETKFDYDHSDNRMAYFVATHVVRLPDGTNYTVSRYVDVFDSIQKYKDDIAAETSYKTLCGESGCVVQDVFGQRFKSIAYWTMKNGEPIIKTFELTHFKFNYLTNKFEASEKPYGTPYVTREECISYNDIKVIDKDGKTSLNTGINKLLQLDDDQKELVGQFENLLREMRDKDIFLLSDCCEHITAYNFRNVDGYTLNYNPELTESDVDPGENPNDFERADRYGELFKVDGRIEQWGDDSNLFIKRKK